MPEDRNPYYPWYVRDFIAHRKVRRMTYVERGLYRALLDECWTEGSIPDDPTKLADICECPLSVMVEAWPKIRPCFEPTDGLDGMYLIQPRLERERAKIAAFSERQSRNAKRRVELSHGKPRQATASRGQPSDHTRTEQSRSTPDVTHAAKRQPTRLAEVLAQFKPDELP